MTGYHTHARLPKRANAHVSSEMLACALEQDRPSHGQPLLHEPETDHTPCLGTCLLSKASIHLLRESLSWARSDPLAESTPRASQNLPPRQKLKLHNGTSKTVSCPFRPRVVDCNRIHMETTALPGSPGGTQGPLRLRGGRGHGREPGSAQRQRRERCKAEIPEPCPSTVRERLHRSP